MGSPFCRTTWVLGLLAARGAAAYTFSSNDDFKNAINLWFTDENSATST